MSQDFVVKLQLKSFEASPPNFWSFKVGRFETSKTKLSI